MRLVIQRVRSGCVRLASTKETVGAIGRGLLILWGIAKEDVWEDAEYCIRKCLNVKLWGDDDEKPWSASAKDLGYELLVVSQFTLFGLLKKGNKPDFHRAMHSSQSRDFFDRIVLQFKKDYAEDKIQTGAFGQRMEVVLENDGPVTLTIDTSTVQLKRKGLPASPSQSSPAPSSEAEREDSNVE